MSCLMSCRTALLIPFFLLAAPASAGLFDDNEARRLATEAKAHAEERLDQQASAQLDLAQQIQNQSDEIAKLRGQIETLNYELDLSKKRQQDLYLDVDSRLRRFEGMGDNAATNATPPAAASTENIVTASPPTANPISEADTYEAALQQFQTGKYKAAVTAFSDFVRSHPNSKLAPSAQFWLGNAWYAQGQCKKSIEAQTILTSRYANSDKAPDAWLAIATCQQELGNADGARRAHESLVDLYPKSVAADKARTRLKK